jgi:hypothetical protein
MDADAQPSLFEQLLPSLSSDRIGTYLKAAGFDRDRALRMYLWNAQVGEAFHLPIQAVEVGLRNRVSAALTEKYYAEWWRNQHFMSAADPQRLGEIDVALRRIEHRGVPLATPQVVATLSFGFWVGMLHSRYNPALWTTHLRAAFPHLPENKFRADLSDSAKRVSYLRNRIWHHEPIIGMNITDEFRATMEILNWICPVKMGWIRGHCRVLALVRQKP